MVVRSLFTANIPVWIIDRLHVENPTLKGLSLALSHQTMIKSHAENVSGFSYSEDITYGNQDHSFTRGGGYTSGTVAYRYVYDVTLTPRVWRLLMNQGPISIYHLTNIRIPIIEIHRSAHLYYGDLYT